MKTEFPGHEGSVNFQEGIGRAADVEGDQV